jgi:hypothetical protein
MADEITDRPKYERPNIKPGNPVLVLANPELAMMFVVDEYDMSDPRADPRRVKTRNGLVIMCISSEYFPGKCPSYWPNVRVERTTDVFMVSPEHKIYVGEQGAMEFFDENKQFEQLETYVMRTIRSLS